MGGDDTGKMAPEAADTYAEVTSAADRVEAPAAEAADQTKALAAEAADQTKALAAEAADQTKAPAAEAAGQTEALPAEAAEQAEEAPQAGGRAQDNRTMRSGLMILVCAYIIYLGVSILRGYFAGEAGDMPAPVAIICGIFFIAAGAGYIIYLAKPLLTNMNQNQTGSSSAAEDKKTSIEDKP